MKQGKPLNLQAFPFQETVGETDLPGFLVSLHNSLDLQLFCMYSLLFDRLLLEEGQDSLKVPGWYRAKPF